VNVSPKKARHTLFSSAEGALEVLKLQVFFDDSSLMIFINGRIAISTRVYVETGRCFGVRWISRNSDSRISGDLDQEFVHQHELEKNDRPSGRKALVEGVFWSLKETIHFAEV
jgi:hypothetical protein